MLSVTPPGWPRADGWIRTSMGRFTRPVPFCFEPHRQSPSAKIRTRSRSRSSPGWSRTSDLPHVTGMSCRWTTGLAKTPTRIRTRNSSFEARDDHPFHHRGNSGRQGSRTLISVGRTALAERPGQPYPATFRSGRACVSRSLVVSERETQATVSPCSQGSGDRTHALQRPKLADCRFPIPRQWTAGDLNPDLRRAKPASSLWTSSPNQ